MAVPARSSLHTLNPNSDWSQTMLDATPCRWCGAQAAMILARSRAHKQPLLNQRDRQRKYLRVKQLSPTNPALHVEQTEGDEHVRQPSGQIAENENGTSQTPPTSCAVASEPSFDTITFVGTRASAIHRAASSSTHSCNMSILRAT